MGAAVPERDAALPGLGSVLGREDIALGIAGGDAAAAQGHHREGCVMHVAARAPGQESLDEVAPRLQSEAPVTVGKALLQKAPDGQDALAGGTAFAPARLPQPGKKEGPDAVRDFQGIVLYQGAVSAFFL